MTSKDESNFLYRILCLKSREHNVGHVMFYIRRSMNGNDDTVLEREGGWGDERKQKSISPNEKRPTYQ
jgi:hypothetical protein